MQVANVAKNSGEINEIAREAHAVPQCISLALKSLTVRIDGATASQTPPCDKFNVASLASNIEPLVGKAMRIADLLQQGIDRCE